MGLFDFFKHKPQVKVEVLEPHTLTDEKAAQVAAKLAETTPDSMAATPSDIDLVESDATTVEVARSTDQTVVEDNLETHADDLVAAKQAAQASMGISESDASIFASTSVSESQAASVTAASLSVSESQAASEAKAAESASISEMQATSESLSADLVSEAEAANKETDTAEADKKDLDQGLSKTRHTWSERWNQFMSNFRSVDEDFFDDLEETLIGADVGAQTAVTLTDELRDEVKLKNAKSKDQVSKIIIEKLIELYERQGVDEDASMHINSDGLTVILFVGVNGVGKTTTIGKMSQYYKQAGKKVVLAAADTFRAGATEQLVEWGRRNDIPVVTGDEKADPASVVYDGVKTAQADGADILFVDTAGRLQNNVNLMQELSKMKRIIQREIPEAPQEVLLVLDATTGQNALQQARLFKDSTDVTGIVLTKLDGTAKGGIILPIRNELHLPVKWVGVGEQVSDLKPFDANEFVKGLFGPLLEEK
ncbi:fused signal recognition particle receptor [Weissella uvarum]|uniref:signal recognition particle-docking protein FtsY n=1 Tax=Weissella uvarum TaxID=1479233 RepID=UPI001960F02D|nr:signal recognition particle-docking protein FtsY [Weissella uvarum]MBM7617753.1 fused signal recognition particle receptor [Weissella uvarum]MCM0595868.1 signal recognition particle-docking protein FtsY [Weissella uvarum]